MSNISNIQEYLDNIDNIMNHLHNMNTNAMTKTILLDMLDDIDNQIDVFNSNLDNSTFPKLQRNIISEFP